MTSYTGKEWRSKNTLRKGSSNPPRLHLTIPTPTLTHPHSILHNHHPTPLNRMCHDSPNHLIDYWVPMANSNQKKSTIERRTTYVQCAEKLIIKSLLAHRLLGYKLPCSRQKDLRRYQPKMHQLIQNRKTSQQPSMFSANEGLPDRYLHHVSFMIKCHIIIAGLLHPIFNLCTNSRPIPSPPRLRILS